MSCNCSRPTQSAGHRRRTRSVCHTGLGFSRRSVWIGFGPSRGMPCLHPSGLHPGHVAGVRLGDRRRGSAGANEWCGGGRRSYLSRARSDSTRVRRVQVGAGAVPALVTAGRLSSNTTLDCPAALRCAFWLAVRPGCFIEGRGYNAPRVRPRSSTARQPADWLGSEPVMEGLTDRLVTMAGQARLATAELVGQEGDILIGGGVGGGSGGTGQPVQVRRGGQR